MLLQWLQIEPADVEVRAYLARAYLDSGRHKDAIEEYKTLLQFDPKNGIALNSLAWELQDEAASEAMHYAQQAFEITPDDAAVVDTLGWLLVKNHDLLNGITLLRKAVALDPDTPEIRFHFARALLEATDTAQARTELETVVGTKKQFSQREEARSLLAKIGR